MGTYTDLLKLKPNTKPTEANSGAVVIAHFPSPEPPPAAPPALVSPVEVERSEERTEKRSERRTPTLPVKRPTRRYSFEFYDDQIQRLKLLKREAEDRGEQITLSDIAREALDRYLHTRKK